MIPSQIIKIAILAYFILMNAAAFTYMGLDKQRARKNQWRIKEKTLFITAILGGSLGAILGMQVFRHKTKHSTFRYGMPAILLLHIILFGLWGWQAL
jgi:uncharacterized membrane protein YsdA (DUF1294 family)